MNRNDELKNGGEGGGPIDKTYLYSVFAPVALRCNAALVGDLGERSLKSVLQGISSLLNAYTSEKTLIAPEDEYIGSALTALVHR